VFGVYTLDSTPKGLVDANEIEVQRYSLQKGDILFIRSSVKPTGVGLTAVVLHDMNETIYSGFLIRFRPLENIFNLMFSAYCFHAPGFRSDLLEKSSISANTNINQQSLKKISIALPTLEEQQAIAAVLSAGDREIEALERKLNKWRDQKKYLLNNLVTGSIRLPEFIKG
jgi:type I restriction enzyme S subunit